MRYGSRRSFLLLAIIATLTTNLAGCGPPRTEVTGQVTYNGKPLDKPNGTIAFLGSTGIPVTASIDSDGNYRAVGVVLGMNKVAVSYMRSVSPSKSKSHVPDPNKWQDPPRVPESPFVTPETYAVPETSDLSVVVEKNTVYSPKLTGPDIK